MPSSQTFLLNYRYFLFLLLFSTLIKLAGVVVSTHLDRGPLFCYELRNLIEVKQKLRISRFSSLDAY